MVLIPLGCGENLFTAPGTENLEILIVRGDGQFGEPGALLPVPLEVRVETLSTGRGEEGISVQWKVLEGVGAILGEARSVTDSTGLTSTTLTLGSQLGAYRVRASVGGMVSPPVEFLAQAIQNPELTEVPGDPVRAGDTIQVFGRNLSTNPQENVVTFSSVRGRVLTASSTELAVEVPACLPSRGVEVKVHLGTVTTNALPLQVIEGDQFFTMERGDDVILDAAEGFACIRLPSAPGARYLVVPHTTGTVGGADYDFGFVGLAEDSLSGALAAPAGAPRDVRTGGAGHEPVDVDLQWAWDARLRALEGEALRERGSGEGGEARVGSDREGLTPQGVPQVGDSREFNVLNAENQFDKVTAKVEHITDHAVIYLDEDTPSGGFTPSDLA
jgi:hypothetical protein